MSLSVFEMRTYHALPGRMAALLARFRDHTIKIFERHGIHSVGYWTPRDQPDELVYILRHEREPALNWAAFKSDPEWLYVREKSTINGPLTSNITSIILQATDFSPLR